MNLSTTAVELLMRVKRRVGSAADATPPTVLVVDDEASIRDYVGRVLRQAGYRTVMAAPGAPARRRSA